MSELENELLAAQSDIDLYTKSNFADLEYWTNCQLVGARLS